MSGVAVMPCTITDAAIVAMTYVPQLRNTIYQQLERLAGEE